MPFYDYKCTQCDNIQEECHGMNDSPDVECEKCGAECSKAFLTSTPVIYKCSGFYFTDKHVKKRKKKP